MNIDDVKDNLLNAICKLSVIQSVDVDVLMHSDPDALNKAHNLLYGIKEIVDLAQKDIHECVLKLEK